MLILYTPLDSYRPLVSTVTHPRLVTSVNICCFFSFMNAPATADSHRAESSFVGAM